MMKTLKDIGEFQLIDMIRTGFKPKSGGLILGIGDDCAVIVKAAKSVYLISTDILTEGVHFDLSFFSAKELGMKTAAVNLSDIAAMGGNPKYLLVSIAVSKKISIGFIKDFFSGIKKVCSKYGVELIGGDTSSSKGGFFISVTVIGEAKRGGFVTRSGASPGDSVYVTGTLGNSAAGLDILKSGQKAYDPVKKYLVKKHKQVTPRIDEGRFLAGSKPVNSMLDMSDGLGSDLRRICEKSGTGAKVFIDTLPVTKQLKDHAKHTQKNTFDFALYGGEDYELLFTVNKKGEGKLKADYQERFKRKIFRVGEITAGDKMLSVDVCGNSDVITGAYTHFLL